MLTVEAVCPLPKSQLYAKLPPVGSTDPEASKVTSRGATPESVLTVKEAIGLPSVTVIVIVLLSSLLPSTNS